MEMDEANNRRESRCSSVKDSSSSGNMQKWRKVESSI